MRVHILYIVWVRDISSSHKRFSGPSTKKTQVLAVTSAEFQRYETRMNVPPGIGVRECGRHNGLLRADVTGRSTVTVTVTLGSYRKLHALI